MTRTWRSLAPNGDEVICTVEDCGCWHETHYSAVGSDVTLIRLEICGECFDSAAAHLEKLTLDKGSQLTLPLPSAEGDRGRTDG